MLWWKLRQHRGLLLSFVALILGGAIVAAVVGMPTTSRFTPLGNAAAPRLARATSVIVPLGAGSAGERPTSPEVQATSVGLATHATPTTVDTIAGAFVDAGATTLAVSAASTDAAALQVLAAVNCGREQAGVAPITSWDAQDTAVAAQILAALARDDDALVKLQGYPLRAAVAVPMELASPDLGCAFAGVDFQTLPGHTRITSLGFALSPPDANGMRGAVVLGR